MNKQHNGILRQQGAALVVGLMMLLALTLIGVTNMSMNSMGLRMASNWQNKANAFQAAEAGIESGIAGTDFDDIDNQQSITAPTLTTAVVSVVSEHKGFTAGIACVGGHSMETVRCNNFEIEATGEHVDSNALVRHVQGIYMIAPALNP